MPLPQSMDQAAITAASGLHARMQALDLLSNNLANSATGGYKLDREFYSLFSSDEITGLETEGQPSQLPFVKGQWTDFTQGTLTPTGNPLDLALDGPGFFVVNGQSGPLYTRNGSFQISSSGILTTPDGHVVATMDGQPIQTQSQSRLQIANDGTVTQDGQTLGQLKIVDFPNKINLAKQGNSYFVNNDPKVLPATSDASITQSRIEQSNVAPAESAVRLVDVMRQFEMLQKAINITTDMNKEALQQVAQVGGGA